MNILKKWYRVPGFRLSIGVYIQIFAVISRLPLRCRSSENCEATMRNLSLISLCVMAVMLFSFEKNSKESIVQQQPSEQKIAVEILMFSGVPNPTFTISDSKEIASIHELIKNLTQSSGDARYGMGFTGFRITNEGAPNFPEMIDVLRNDKIVIIDGGKQSTFNDDKGLFEKLADKTMSTKFQDTHLTKIIHSWITEAKKEKENERLTPKINSKEETVNLPGPLSNDTVTGNGANKKKIESNIHSGANDNSIIKHEIISGKEKYSNIKLLLVIVGFIIIVISSVVAWVLIERLFNKNNHL